MVFHTVTITRYIPITNSIHCITVTIGILITMYHTQIDADEDADTSSIAYVKHTMQIRTQRTSGTHRITTIVTNTTSSTAITVCLSPMMLTSRRAYWRCAMISS